MCSVVLVEASINRPTAVVHHMLSAVARGHVAKCQSPAKPVRPYCLAPCARAMRVISELEASMQWVFLTRSIDDLCVRASL